MNNSSPVKSYISAAKRYTQHLISHPEALKNLEALINQRGHEYFSPATGHIWGPYHDVELELFMGKDKKKTIRVLNKATFAEEMDLGIWQDEAAFDDSFRHTILVDISNMDNPILVEAPTELISAKTDWILTWPKVQELPNFFPDGNIVAVHVDQEYPFLPIPTHFTGGRRKVNKSRKRKSRKSKI